jgi:hypothetical protein
MDSYFIGIVIRIRMTSRESVGNKNVVHFGIPISGRLLNTIEIFLKVKNKARVILDIAKRFFHVYLFFQISMKEGGFNIHLMELPFM